MMRISLIIIVISIFLIDSLVAEVPIDKFNDRQGEVLSIQCARALYVSINYVRSRLASPEDKYSTEYDHFIGSFDLIECIDAGNNWVIGFRVIDEHSGTVALDSSVRIMLDKKDLTVIESSF